MTDGLTGARGVQPPRKFYAASVIARVRRTRGWRARELYTCVPRGCELGRGTLTPGPRPPRVHSAAFANKRAKRERKREGRNARSVSSIAWPRRRLYIYTCAFSSVVIYARARALLAAPAGNGLFCGEREVSFVVYILCLMGSLCSRSGERYSSFSRSFLVYN